MPSNPADRLSSLNKTDDFAQQGQNPLTSKMTVLHIALGQLSQETMHTLIDLSAGMNIVHARSYLISNIPSYEALFREIGTEFLDLNSGLKQHKNVKSFFQFVLHSYQPHLVHFHTEDHAKIIVPLLNQLNIPFVTSFQDRAPSKKPSKSRLIDRNKFKVSKDLKALAQSRVCFIENTPQQARMSAALDIPQQKLIRYQQGIDLNIFDRHRLDHDQITRYKSQLGLMHNRATIFIPFIEKDLNDIFVCLKTLAGLKRHGQIFNIIIGLPKPIINEANQDASKREKDKAEQVLEDLNAMLERLNLSDDGQVLAHGFDQSLAHLLHLSDLCIINTTSRIRGLDLVLAAQAMMCPVMIKAGHLSAEHIQSFPFYLPDERSGWIISNQDEIALNAALLDFLATSTDDLHAISEIAYRNAKFHSHEACLAKVLAVYEQLSNTALLDEAFIAK